MKRVLLTVSGTIPANLEAQVQAGQRPLPDYLALARGFPADLLDYAGAAERTGLIGRLLRAVGGKNLMLAWACFRAGPDYAVIFTDGEQIGLPLAVLYWLSGRRARPRHLMIAHWLSVGKKMVLLDWLRLQRYIDLFFVYSTWQQRFIESRWAVPAERVVWTPFMVDADFFDPAQTTAPASDFGLPASADPVICAVGLEFRDYGTLIEAVRGLKLQLIIAAASPWSKRASQLGSRLPANVVVRRFTQFELRQLYARSQLVVMPLHPVTFQAGVTALLEAMAMAKPVLCSRTPGQTDVVVEGVTGRYVPPYDPPALRAAIEQLLAHPAEAAALGRGGRRAVEEALDLRHYVTRLAAFVTPVSTSPESAGAQPAGLA